VTGISFYADATAPVKICIFDEISSDLEIAFRNYLSSICHGTPVGEKPKSSFTYKKTLQEFLKRYDPKDEDKQKGMIGELVTHVLIRIFLKEFQISSLFFNMEESNVKKGFDLILFETSQKVMFIAEVKSGDASDDRSDQKNVALLSAAKSDLSAKLTSQQTHSWQNAIYGAHASMDAKNIRAEVVEILDSALSEAQEGTDDKANKHVILVSVTYNDLSDRITLERVKAYLKNCSGFASCLLFSIQKDSHKSIELFLRKEGANE
jgi:hypothetical protein